MMCHLCELSGKKPKYIQQQTATSIIPMIKYNITAIEDQNLISINTVPIAWNRSYVKGYYLCNAI